MPGHLNLKIDGRDTDPSYIWYWFRRKSSTLKHSYILSVPFNNAVLENFQTYFNLPRIRKWNLWYIKIILSQIESLFTTPIRAILSLFSVKTDFNNTKWILHNINHIRIVDNFLIFEGQCSLEDDLRMKFKDEGSESIFLLFKQIMALSSYKAPICVDFEIEGVDTWGELELTSGALVGAALSWADESDKRHLKIDFATGLQRVNDVLTRYKPRDDFEVETRQELLDYCHALQALDQAYRASWETESRD